MGLAGELRNKKVAGLAKAGLVAKGCVYVLLGALALMAALHIGNQSAGSADKSSAFKLLDNSFAGKWLLPVLAVGLLCYCLWRCIQAVKIIRGGKKYQKAARYLISAAAYAFVCYSAVKLILDKPVESGDSQQSFASQLLSQPLGQWMVAAVALVFVGVGIYQLYYGWSEKYKKHTQKMNNHSQAASILLTMGKVGYFSRGIVWLVIAYLMVTAAFTRQPSKAGNTGKALEFIESMPWGNVLLLLVAAGLMAYGAFAFVRARYEELNDNDSLSS